MRYLIPRVRGIIIMPAKSCAISLVFLLALSVLSPVNAEETDEASTSVETLDCEGIENLEFD